LHGSRKRVIGLALWALAAHGRCGAKEWTDGDTRVTISGLAGIGAYAVPRANFGTGSYDIRTVREFSQGLRNDVGRPVRSPAWGEAFLKPSLRFTHDLASGGSVFGEVSAVLATTFGDGDATVTSFTRGNPRSISIEQAYLGYRATPPFGLKGDSLVVQIGRQDFILDDGFLIHLARFNIGRQSNFYLSPRGAFDGWGTVRLNTAPVRGDIFVLSTPVDNKAGYGNRDFVADQPNTDFAGFDVEWFEPVARKEANAAVNFLDRARYLNFTYLTIFNSDRDRRLYGDDSPFYWARRKGLHVFSLSGGGTLIPIRSLALDRNGSLYFQYVRQLNWTRGRKVDATAFYIEPGYAFSDVAWSPAISYRYSYFSGNRAAPGAPFRTKRSYDPLFLGGGFRDYLGNWGPGEIIGTYMLPSSNLVVHQLELKLTAPFHLAREGDALQFELLAYQFLLDRTAPARATSRRFAREIDVSARYVYDERTTAAVVLGAAFAQRGARQWFDAATDSFPGVRRARGNSYIAEFYVVRGF
jgi:hypothetical protein